jgi:hypothetical protein
VEKKQESSMKKSARKSAIQKSAGRKPSFRTVAPRQTAAVKKTGRLAVKMLMEDHEKVKKLFSKFESLKKQNAGPDEKAEIVRAACAALSLHDRLETEIFYPAIRPAIRDNDIMDEAEVEHDGVRALIAQLSRMKSDDDLYDARFTVLAEQVRHHVREEESIMFAEARKAAIDLDALGREMARRKREFETDAEQSPFGIMPTPVVERGVARLH